MTLNPEWMDQPCSFEDLQDCLRGIASVNRLTLAYRPTLDWLNHVYTVMPRQTRPLHIVDVGCGYGDYLRKIQRWAEEKNLPVVLTGLDLNPDAIQAARAATIPGTITFLAGNIYDYDPPVGIDLVVNSLLMHHLEGGEIVDLLDWMESRARMGWFINDLHRLKMSWQAFRMLARVMPWHRFVKHDGPVSILRSFREEDWREMLAAAAIPADGYLLRGYWPGRLCVARLK